MKNHIQKALLGHCYSRSYPLGLGQRKKQVKRIRFCFIFWFFFFFLTLKVPSYPHAFLVNIAGRKYVPYNIYQWGVQCECMFLPNYWHKPLFIWQYNCTFHMNLHFMYNYQNQLLLIQEYRYTYCFIVKEAEGRPHSPHSLHHFRPKLTIIQSDFFNPTCLFPQLYP